MAATLTKGWSSRPYAMERAIATVEAEYGEPFMDVIHGYATDGESVTATAAIVGVSETLFRRWVKANALHLPWRKGTKTNGWVSADRYKDASGKRARAARANLEAAHASNRVRFAQTRVTTPALLARADALNAAGNSWRSMPKLLGVELYWTTIRKQHKKWSERNEQSTHKDTA